MKRGPRHSAIVRPAAAWTPIRRALVALICILAFSLQGYIGQTHIHAARGGDSVSRSVFSNSFAGVSADRKAPSQPDQGQDNPYRCPYCQVAASLGAMLGVSVLLITMPAAQLAVEPLANLAAAADSPASYVQRNRGPPLR
ncbi:MAG TPA: DUF2946 family protein [Rhizomicrobium sp.]|nr:DUF2946 family protein [Rhizomicrobium sp.]